MASRTDITPVFSVLPRLLIVGKQQTTPVSLTIQDLIDTSRDIEYSWEGMSRESLIKANGKQDLGSGLSVGITATLQNTRVQFQTQTSLFIGGTISASGTLPIHGTTHLFASGSNLSFVKIGWMVLIAETHAIAEVVEVVSNDEIITTIPQRNDLDTEYNTGQHFDIFITFEAIISGGNLTAVNENLLPISPVIHTSGMKVVLEKSISSSIITVNVPTVTDVNLISIDGSTLAAQLLRLSAETMTTGTISSVSSNQTFNISFDNTVLGSLAGKVLFFITGTKLRGVTRIQSVDLSALPDPEVTVTALSSPPFVGDMVIIL